MHIFIIRATAQAELNVFQEVILSNFGSDQITWFMGLKYPLQGIMWKTLGEIWKP